MECQICGNPATAHYCDKHDPSQLLGGSVSLRLDLSDISSIESARKASGVLMDFILNGATDANAIGRVKIAHDMLLRHSQVLLKGKEVEENEVIERVADALQKKA